MKSIRWSLLLFAAIIANISYAQKPGQINLADSTGLPGDNFSLQGALGAFKESKSLEDFEKRINSKDNIINNLDLNGDKKVDYVKVVADKKENARVVILQVPVSKTESQDVAVIEIEKNGDKSALLQILGDKELYGDTKIVEPKADEEPADQGINKKGPSSYSPAPVVFVNVWFWPIIPFMFDPGYVVYVSPWYWDFYPGWWYPWHPFAWRYHYMHTWHYHHYCHVVYDHRVVYAHQVYAPRRTSSVVVVNRYRDARASFDRTHPNRPRPNIGQASGRKTGEKLKPQTPQVKAKPQVKPSNQAPARPVERPTTKPDNNQAPARPAERPQTKPDNNQAPARPIERPETKPEKSSPDQPRVKPENQGPRQLSRPQTRPTNKPQQAPKQRKNPR